MNRIAKYLFGEDGAITADWVLLTAGLVGFGAIIFVNLSPSIQHVDNQTGNALRGAEVRDPSFQIPASE
ncbi:hypothetical protein RUESEDTHA_01756 [Ruegeria sp. THAF57]|uniref:hypothetical protein n=1 Tax=unclassified Ruegeria TaxID=2625375 RepID=UPI001488FBBD|nr:MULTISPECIES: hypothetical protein [unclassified Ruegeria]CAD0184873.1 hypothetical protein RUESEDTHA_01756 [Ruegeria sp. THAF57]